MPFNFHCKWLPCSDFHDKGLYILQMWASPQLQKFELFILFHAQAKYGSELGGDYQNTVCKPYFIHTSQEYAHTTGLLDQYFQHLTLCHLTQSSYQQPTMDVFETKYKLY